MYAAGGQGRILFGKLPIAQASTIHLKPPLSVTEASNLAHLPDILMFARKAGLNTGDAYRTFYPGDPTYTVWVVTASPITAPALENWWFPVVGKVPYLGYFSLQEAEARVAVLRTSGFETALRPASAYSTLGWFSDPVYRAQLRSSGALFAETVLHELTHRTVYRAGDSAWNESVAEFTGRRFLELLAAEVVWLSAKQLTRWRAINGDSEILDKITGVAVSRLTSLYAREGEQGYAARHTEIVEEFARDLTDQAWSVYSGKRLAGLDWSVPALLGARLYSSGADQLWPPWNRLTKMRRGSELARSWVHLLQECLEKSHKPLCRKPHPPLISAN